MLQEDKDPANVIPEAANSDSQTDGTLNTSPRSVTAADDGLVSGSDADPSPGAGLETDNAASAENGRSDGTNPSSDGRNDLPVPSSDASRAIVVRQSHEQRGVPDNLLLMVQLHEAISRSSLDSEAIREQMAADTEDLYRGLDPRSIRDSIICRNIVAANDATMKCFGRAAQTNDSFALQINLKFAFKGAQTIAQLIEVYDKLRSGRSPAFSIGPVNVEAGAQAIVGEVTMRDRRHLANGHKQLPHPEEEDSNE
jgi:hypothetical protein